MTALGLNLLNMAVIAPLVAFAFVKVLGRGFDQKGKGVGVPLAAWASVFVTAVICGGQLALSYTISDGAFGIDGIISIPAMTIYHAVIAFGEAIITSGVVLFLSKVAPETLEFGFSPKEVQT